jgi:hypothetical protein
MLKTLSIFSKMSSLSFSHNVSLRNIISVTLTFLYMVSQISFWVKISPGLVERAIIDIFQILGSYWFCLLRGDLSCTCLLYQFNNCPHLTLRPKKSCRPNDLGSCPICLLKKSEHVHSWPQQLWWVLCPALRRHSVITCEQIFESSWIISLQLLVHVALGVWHTHTQKKN